VTMTGSFFHTLRNRGRLLSGPDRRSQMEAELPPPLPSRASTKPIAAKTAGRSQI
jgi:hypothetical protein